MKLKICNLAKVKNAEIDVDGLTVIAGSNNTGKSTVGKVISSLFNSLNDLENKIFSRRSSSIGAVCRVSVQSVLSHRTALVDASRPTLSLLLRLAREIASQIITAVSEDPILLRDDIEEIILTTFTKYDISLSYEDYSEITNEILSKITEILSLPDKAISQALVTKGFGETFNNQINALHNNEEATIELNLKSRKIAINFVNHKCASLDSGISILHKAIYIDNPFVIDKLDDDDNIEGDDFLVDLIRTKYYADDSQIIESVLAEKKMDKIFKMLSSVVNGRILVQSGNYFLEDENADQPISVKNLSSGLKSFVLLKMLVESGIIRDNDVLILDEPEVHLHPEWQVVYAELIVLLQKQLNLSVIVTTHSPYFLDAIDLFARKHKVDDKTNYYLSRTVGNQAEFQKVTNSIDLIYKEMASPIDLLETLRYELAEE